MDEDGDGKYHLDDNNDVGNDGDMGNNDDGAYDIDADEDGDDYDDVDDDYDDVDHLMRNGGDKGIGPVTTSQVEIATIHKVQPGNSSLSSSLPLSSSLSSLSSSSPLSSSLPL